MTDELPPGWATAPLGSLGDWLGGGTPSKAVHEYWRDGTVHWVSPKDMKRPLIDSAQDQITEKAVRESATNLVPANSVLMVTRSGILEHSFPVAVNTVPVTMNQDLKAITVRGVDSIYTSYFLQSRAQDILRTCKKDGTTVASIDTDRLVAYGVAIAPAPEQKRIVSKIDELFSRIDEGERALERVSMLVERYRQSVLKAAVTGELTREWREKNKDKLKSGEALLARILKARREAWEKAELAKMKAKGITPANDKWKQKYEEPASPDTSELPELPKGWTYAAIDQLLAADKDAMKTGPFGSLLQKSEHVADGVPVLGIENVKARRFVPGSNIHVTAEKASELIGYRVVGGDIVISRSGTVGEVCVVPDGLGDARISTNLMKVSLAVEALLPDLLACQLCGSPVVLRTIDRLCKGSTRNFLNQTILRALPLVVPPLDEQEAILGALRVAEQNIDALGDSLELELRRAATARQSVLSSAFAGRLVGQDPTDEPASTLLERIAAERTAVGATSPRRGRRRKSA